MEINSMSTPVIGNSSPQAGVKPVVVGQKPVQGEASVASPSLKTQQETQKETIELVAKVNSTLEQLGVGVSFSVDENTQSSVVKVIDRSTDEVIKQFPNEGSLRIMQNIQNYLDSVRQSGSTSKEGLTGALFSEII